MIYSLFLSLAGAWLFIDGLGSIVIAEPTESAHRWLNAGRIFRALIGIGLFLIGASAL